MTKSFLDRTREALASGDTAEAEQNLERTASQFGRLQQYSVNWIAQLLSYIGRQAGEASVEAALRDFGDTYLDQSSAGQPDWNSLDAETRADVIAQAMLANGATCAVSDDDQKIVLEFRCGTGGRLIDDGAYEGEDALLTLRERAPRTFDRDSLPVYCAHCSVNNEMQPIEKTGYPVTVQFPPTGPGEACVHHIYRNLDDIPVDVYERVNLPRPAPNLQR